MSSLTKIFAVTGRPILHSKSPNMFNSVFEAKNMDAVYVRLAAKDAKQAIFLCKSLDIKGMNVTAPFKEDMLKLVDEIHEEANLIGGINTIVNKDGKLHGYNTDHYGVTQSFIDAGISLQNKKCVVIGAGGAAKAAVYGLLQHGATVTVCNRTEKKAEKIAKNFNCKFTSVEELQSHIENCDIILSSLTQKVNLIQAEWLQKHHIVFDANYKGSLLLPIAQEKGCTIVNAEDWLLNQATAAYTLFLEEPADKNLMKQGLLKPSLAEQANCISTIGLMGAGKTSHGKVLAKKLKYVFKDIDEEIVASQHMPITQIFEEKGEAFFRSLEKKELSKNFESHDPHLISCGGGIVLNTENRELLKNNSIVVWLYASPKAIMERVDISKRPLLQVENPLAKLQEILVARKGLYAQTAHVIVSTEKKQKEATTKRIVEEIKALL